jgi:hypothetical protein
MKTEVTYSAAAGFLESVRVIANMSNAGGVVGGVACALAGPEYARVVLAGSLLLWFLVLWLAVRVAIDANLFRTMAAADEGEAVVDQLLSDWGFRATPKHDSMDGRIRGSLRLWRLAALTLAIQLALLATGLTMRLLNV